MTCKMVFNVLFNFNSIKVRLDLPALGNKFVLSEFQFHKGTIRPIA